MDVVLTARTASQAEAVAADIGGQALIFDVAEVETAIAEVKDAGPFDVLVNNAGVDQSAFFTDTTPDDWRALIAVNLEGVLATTLAALQPMQAAGYGRIVNVASEAGRLGSKRGSVYAAAKGGVIAFTKSIARENARYGITANTVCPGPVETPLLDAKRDQGAVGEQIIEAMKAATLVGRLGTSEEVAAVVAFLSSEEASFVTGETLGVSGGMGVGT
jgi:NAD(P)-dependent dehydrogenase (short-subunit alcohol dehydrogenase family)